MPKKNVVGDFVMNPNYDEASDIANTIQEMRLQMNKLLQCIDSISESTFQLISMFSMIDSMAQESADYPIRDSREAFCDFVLKHQNRYDYLEMVEPITLYYHVEDLLSESVLNPGLPPEKVMGIDSLGYFYICNAKK